MTKTVIRAQLTTKQKLDLGNLLVQDYVKSGLSDVDFAKMATEKLGFSISAGSVAHYRKSLDIEANENVSASSLKARVAELEKLNRTLIRALIEADIELPEGVEAPTEEETL